MQMILPAAREMEGTTPRRLNSRAAARAQRNWPVRFTPMTVFHCSRVISVNAESRCKPALHTTTCKVPNSAMAAANIFSTSELVACVGSEGDGLAAHLLDLLNYLVGGLRVDDVIYRDVCPGSRQTEGHSFADSRICARDKGGLTGQHFVVWCSRQAVHIERSRLRWFLGSRLRISHDVQALDCGCERLTNDCEAERVPRPRCGRGAMAALPLRAAGANKQSDSCLTLGGCAQR